MPTATYIALANVTLTGSDSNIVFSSIPATYRDLVVVCSFNVASGNIRARFNSDTGNNYNMVRMYAGNGFGPASDSFSSTHFEFGDVSSGQTTLLIDIMDYSATDKHKTTLSKDASAGDRIFYHANRFASTSAVTSIDIFRSTGSFGSGDSFALYGIVS